MLKNLVKNLKPSSTLAINETSRELEKKGKKIFKFGFGQSPFMVPQDVVNELKNNANQNKYLPMQGLSELREAVAKYTSNKKNYNYKSENVIIGPGSKELMFLLHIIFDGEIILPTPSWVSYAPQAILGRNKVKILQTKRGNNWFPTAIEIEEIILKDKSKNYLIFLNSPNNPSGQICENLKEISDIANKYNLIILSDEIYSELSFENNYESISNFCPEKTIISSGLSKWCGAGGWRLGYFIVPNSLEEIKITAQNVKDPNFRIQITSDGLHVYNRDGLRSGQDPFQFYEKLGVEEDSSHAFYLGVELARAEIAWSLGKRYAQDRGLDWGAAAEPRREDALTHCQPKIKKKIRS